MSVTGVPASAERAGSQPPPIIRVDRVGKTYSAHGQDLVVFNNLSCEIARRSFLSIVGPSGCGKSTLLKLICGLERATSGMVLFNETPISRPPKGMIYVFQQYTKSIFPWRTVIQNVAFGLGTHKNLGADEAHQRCLEYIRLVGLEGYERYYPYQLSGGMQQRVCIARALICEPDVLLMDEPFSAVDAMTRAILQELILKIWDTLAITILFVTHDVEEAVFLSSRIISLGRAPSAIRDDLVCDLPYPRDQIRTRDDGRFRDLRQRLFSSIFMQEKAAVAEIEAAR
jgi:NitT/TauT family transport system ATP-binding protein